MFRLSILLSLVLFAFCADHDTFKDCSRVEFCNNLRSKPTSNYSVNDTSFAYIASERKFIFELFSDAGPKLNLNITLLINNTIRVQIGEENSQRYQLQDVLDGQPKVANETTNYKLGRNIVIIYGDGYTVHINYINSASFKMDFYLDDSLQVTFDGSLLNFQEQAFTLGVDFPLAYQLYGIHEHADNLALEDGTEPYRLRNLDVSGFELNSPMALYGSVPVLYAHGPNGTSGIFLHNAAEQWYDITNGPNTTSAYVMVESGALDLFVLLGPTPRDVVRQYVGLTGTAHLPQLWALGYHQSRWNYVSQEDIKDVVANFTTYDFPMDVIWLDIDYTDEKKYFTWDPETFSDPVEMQQNISAAHKRLVTIIDPHIKVQEGYNVYDGAVDKGLFVQFDNKSFEGDCWPGLSSYMDFLNPEARDYYASFYSYDNFPSTTPVLAGIWNDMNEPSVFDNSLEKTLPATSVHFGGVLHRDIHNIYGLLHTKSTHQGLLQRDNSTLRPFILTRSHFAGTQRYSAIWTGDNQAEWGHLTISYAECLNANLLGIVFCGADVGGFSQDPSTELLQRWYQAGAWLPFYRAHSDTASQRREPFLFSEEIQQVIRNAIRTRYAHLPMWYTLFYEHTRNGDPIIRPLFYHYPSDVNAYNINDHLLVGSDILVRAVSEPAVDSVQVYFPGGDSETWISISDSQVYQGNGFVDVAVDLQHIPVYYRRGSVIVRKDGARLSTDEMANDGYYVYANLDANGRAAGRVYLDDNKSFNYINNKEYNYLSVEFNSGTVTLTAIDPDAISDNFLFNIEQIITNEVVKDAEEDKPGQYKRNVYKTDVNKKLLKDVKIQKTLSIKFA